MNVYQELSSEKYWNEAVQLEIKQLRRQKNREALDAFKMFLFTVIVGAGVLYALNTMPTWLPAVTGFLEYYGVIPTPIPAG